MPLKKVNAMKKKPVVLFPGSEKIHKPEHLEKPLKKSIGLRDTVKIGKPSSRYFQFIHPSLDFDKHRLENLSNLTKNKDVIVLVTSILTMRGGKSIAVLRRLDGKLFQDNLECVFADIDDSIKSNELLDLSLEELQKLNESTD
jgi:muramoyltetrapeptide carboxypeptidase LdcA involved in peptidoglycan recycling